MSDDRKARSPFWKVFWVAFMSLIWVLNVVRLVERFATMGVLEGVTDGMVLLILSFWLVRGFGRLREMSQ